MIIKLTSIFLVCLISHSYAQEDRPLPSLFDDEAKRDEQPGRIFFQKRAHDPITIDVRREINKVSLVGKNTSFYPHTLKFHFNKIRNLVPEPDSLTFILYPGTRVLMNFRIFAPSEDFDFNFKVDKKIGDAEAKPMLDFPYLLPIGKNRFLSIPTADVNDTQDTEVVFEVKQNDTIYAMRKGVVTALPLADDLMLDRISSNSLEIRHVDGTIMVYENVDPLNKLVQLGQTVYPGQAIGISASSELFVSLYDLKDERLTELGILFSVSPDSALPYSKLANGRKVQHPAIIIRREMTKKELKKLSD